MKAKLALAVVALTVLLISCGQPGATPMPYDDTVRGVCPGEVWQEATTPEQLGWSSEKLAKAREYSDMKGEKP